MEVPIVNGIYMLSDSYEFRTGYPRNMVPIPKVQGISQGYLYPADGVIQTATTPGNDRGGIKWNDVVYRVCGSKLVRLASDGSVTVLGDVGNDNKPVSMDWGYDRMVIVSAGDMYFWDGYFLTQVTDPDFGSAIDVCFIDGWYLYTDGTYIVAPDITNPTSINPLRYGASDGDPDRIVGLCRLRRELNVINRYSVEIFHNVSGADENTFPFQSVPGAQIPRGAVGPRAACIFDENIAMMGSARDESISVFIAEGGESAEIATREIAQLIGRFEESVLAECVVETRNTDAQTLLYVHLPDMTLVYDHNASIVMKERIWHILDSSILGKGRYRAWNHVWCYNKWWVGDPTSAVVGYLSDSTGEHYGQKVGWDFTTLVMYNDGDSGQIHEMELVVLSGRHALENAAIWTSFSYDGVRWSMERPIKCGQIGDLTKRMIWTQCGEIKNYRIQKFRGSSDGRISCAKLVMSVEPLNVKLKGQNVG